MTPADIDALRQDITQKFSHMLATGTADREGKLNRPDGSSVTYQTYIGWNIARANECDIQWGKFNIDLIDEISKRNYSKDELIAINEMVQLDDDHWNWLFKSAKYNTDEYKWFFLYADKKPQAACLIYFPKESLLSGNDIFYIEYLAVAPWNRMNPIADRIFLGVGTQMISDVMCYSHNILKLKPGCSLHSLNKAQKFYKKLGMLPIPAYDKPNLAFFEMPESVAIDFLGA
ncbi:hypothetical protein RJO42_003212 [Enterobacter hormaechei]|nr:hypothetical protein [Enterobacter hormaechei]ELC6572657.1 hypothetical protein [Enterobacter hormaechei]MCM7787410.1 GNAT family N-acetyltransferase [Enterobacter hormaechei]